MTDPSIRVRTPQACDRCRRRKIKCDGVKPTCQTCKKRKVMCLWQKMPASDGSTNVGRLEIDGLNSPQKKRPQSATSPDNSDSIARNFPDSPQLERLIDIFFSRHHDVELCSLFHKPSWDVLLLRERSPFLTTSIMALSALYVPDVEARAEFGFASASDLSEHYTQIATNYARELSYEPTVYTVQANLILGLRELLASNIMKCWLHVGTAIRMANLRLGSEYSLRLSPRLKEIRRRTFWACFLMDRLVAYCGGGPHMIMALAIRVQLPCPENVFSFDEEYSGPYLSDILQPSQLSQLGIVPFFIYAVHLWGDMALLHSAGGRRWYTKKPTDPYSEFHQKEQAISDFIDRLPATARWSAHNYKLFQSTSQAQSFVNLHFVLHHAQCVMHQEYLPQLDSPLDDVSGVGHETRVVPERYDSAGLSLDYYDEEIINKCMANAGAIATMATALFNGNDKDKAALQSIFTANALMTASSVLLWAQYTQISDSDLQTESKSRSDTILQIIKSWIPKWKVASAWAETLEMLQKLYHVAYSTPDEYHGFNREDGRDETQDSTLLIEEPDAGNDPDPGLIQGDVILDTAGVYQRLIDKARMIMITPLEPEEIKKKKLRIYLGSLSRNMWGHSSLQTFDGPSLSPDGQGDLIFNFGPLDNNLSLDI